MCFAACAQEPETVTVSLEAAPAPARPEAPEAPEQRTRDGDPHPVGPKLQQVNWDEVEIDPAAVAALPVAQRTKLDAIRMPVLVPNDAALLATAVVTHNGDWYATTTKGDDVTVYIRGSRAAYTVPGMEEVVMPEVMISRTHGIVTATFQRFGASYNLDVECLGPMEDPRCVDDDYIESVVDGLAVVGGAR